MRSKHVGAAAHVPPEQFPLAQSVPAEHILPNAQRGQFAPVAPPQSTSVSGLVFTPSPQYGPTTVLSLHLFVPVAMHVLHVVGGLVYVETVQAVSVFAAPKSHDSPVSMMPSPQLHGQSAGQMLKSSPVSHVPLPHRADAVTVCAWQDESQYAHVWLYPGVHTVPFAP